MPRVAATIDDRTYARLLAIAEARGILPSQAVADLLWAVLVPEDAIDRPKLPRAKGGGRKKKVQNLEDAIDAQT
jgi:hypothetical protein